LGLSKTVRLPVSRRLLSQTCDDEPIDNATISSLFASLSAAYRDFIAQGGCLPSSNACSRVPSRRGMVKRMLTTRAAPLSARHCLFFDEART
jgi:hypothetical protein